MKSQKQGPPTHTGKAAAALIEAKRINVLELGKIQVRVNELQAIVNDAEKAFADAVIAESKQSSDDS